MENQSWFCEKIIYIDKSLAILTKRKREKTQINKLKDEKEKEHKNKNRHHKNPGNIRP